MKVTTLYCQRSGIAIAQIRLLTVGGAPYVRDASKLLYHPIYAKSLDEVIRITKRDLRDLEVEQFNPNAKLLQSLQLDISAILYKLGALLDDYACLPNTKVTVGSANRIVSLASWYHHATSKRIKFPRYHPCKENSNDRWNNLSSYLDACFAVKDDWQNKVREVEDEELKEMRELALLEVKKSTTYKRIDHEKVWNWMATQMEDKYSAGRLVTWHDLWKNGDIEQEKWTVDDIEDLQFAVIECCDVGNEIMHFISTRLKHIREMIKDFYGSFTLLTGSRSVGTNAHPDLTPEEKEKEAAFFSEYDRRIESLSELPAAPQRRDFANVALFMKAEAQHRLLVKRFNAKRGEQE
jgi:hypothetical protein